MAKPPFSIPRVRTILTFNLRKLRLERQLSMEKLANEAGIYRTGYVKIENGAVSPTIDTLEKLSRALRVKVHTLLLEIPDGEGKALLKPLPRGRKPGQKNRLPGE